MRLLIFVGGFEEDMSDFFEGYSGIRQFQEMCLLLIVLFFLRTGVAGEGNRLVYW